MRLLVTGGSGFIGQEVVRQAAIRGHEVRVLDLREPAVGTAPDGGQDAGPAAGHELVLGDVRDADAVRGALDGVDAVCHLAAKVGLGVDAADAPDYVSRNALGTAVVITAMAAAGVTRFAQASSMVVYGEGAYRCEAHGAQRAGERRETDLAAGRFEPACPECDGPLVPGLVQEDAPLDPRNTYAATKVHQEHLAISWARATGSTAVSLRFHNVYGPGMPRDTPYAGVAALFRSALAAGRAPLVFEDGAQRRDFVHVRDVAAATVRAVEGAANVLPGGGHRAYNVGSGVVTTIAEVAAALHRASGGDPATAPRTTGDYRLGDVRHVTASSDRLERELGHRAQVTLTEGMTALAAASPRSEG